MTDYPSYVIFTRVEVTPLLIVFTCIFGVVMAICLFSFLFRLAQTIKKPTFVNIGFCGLQSALFICNKTCGTTFLSYVYVSLQLYVYHQFLPILNLSPYIARNLWIFLTVLQFTLLIPFYFVHIRIDLWYWFFAVAPVTYYFIAIWYVFVVVIDIWISISMLRGILNSMKMLELSTLSTKRYLITICVSLSLLDLLAIIDGLFVSDFDPYNMITTFVQIFHSCLGSFYLVAMMQISQAAQGSFHVSSEGSDKPMVIQK